MPLKSIVIALLFLSACKSTEPPKFYPSPLDLEAVAQAKPKPTAAILTDPKANDMYNHEVEAWGDRIHAAGLRLCRFYQNLGQVVDCGQVPASQASEVPVPTP
ncbi:hypothetical protein [Novosphingobium pentaromativorans]|uniref:Lipoprotein n=1 Tax=Novosphingobium pentaromativorans US6-1 TaxID=1088721 RepID=G6E9R8_9SPHN|nr:hypothetical protein [Novosphingobium pentaromativorans]AIT80931.1 hypothetical protein JI59_14650 [Novosphingobium pentaromativorans US6-1]EHJ61923.1 hypothetical protein NSU_1089 [Novosphingobium pentaromativorans US6-1]